MVRVLIVEDEGLFRDMLKIYLGSIPNLEVVEAVSDGEAAIEAADRLQPDVVLLDIELGSQPNGIAAGRAIKQQNGNIGIIVLSAHKERKYLSLVAREEFSGWSYLLKQSETVGRRRQCVGASHRGNCFRLGGHGSMRGR